MPVTTAAKSRAGIASWIRGKTAVADGACSSGDVDRIGST